MYKLISITLASLLAANLAFAQPAAAPAKAAEPAKAMAPAAAPAAAAPCRELRNSSSG